ncbi:DUF4087 domain-containing protein [Rhizobium sp.]
MKKAALASALVVLFSVATTAVAENRCGWVQNPTPGNWWLTDADGQWTIMTQGSYEAPGMDAIGDISAGDYIANNGNYGYACGCMNVDTDGEGVITRIYSFRQLSIAKCENDSALPSPE